MAPMTPAIMPSWYRRAVSLTGSDRASTVGVARAVMLGSFPGPIDPLSGTRRFYSASVPAWLAGGWRPGLGAGRALHVVHLAVEEDEGLAILDGLATRGAGALLLHASSLPPG